MALPTASPHPLSPQVVGKAFVQQYYEILHRSPELVHKFYLDTSTLSRPNTDGTMSSVTTMQTINEKILSLDYQSYYTEIETADSQPSHKDGVIIVVTGCLIGRDNVRRRFTQSFFLAPQDKGGYFVLNDIVRFVGEIQPIEVDQMLVNGTDDDSPEDTLTPELGQDLVQECDVADVATPVSERDAVKGVEASDPSEKVGSGVENAGPGVENAGSGVEVEIVAAPSVNLSQSDIMPAPEVTAPIAQEDTPKKSYASIVMKGNTLPLPVYVPTAKARAIPTNTDKPMILPTKPVSKPESPVPTSNNVFEGNNSHEAEGHSIYIKSLPLNATVEQIEELLKKFGPIKPGGVQVRSHKVDRICFGFVEFEALDSMQAAIEASPITIGGRQAYIEEKRTTTRVVNGVVTNGGVGNGRGRFLPARGGFRNDSLRGRENARGNNNGYGRSDFRNQGEHTGWSRGRYDGYQRDGNGRIGRPNGMHQTPIAA